MPYQLVRTMRNRLRSPAHPSRPVRCRPSLEALEERWLLATHTWLGIGTPNWSDPESWSPTAPTVGESTVVLIFQAGVSQRATIDDLDGLSVDQIVFGDGYSIAGQTPGTHLAFTGADTAIVAAAAGCSFGPDLVLVLDGTAIFQLANVTTATGGPTVQVDSTITGPGGLTLTGAAR